VRDAGRVIAGSARGVRLLAPGEGTRPLGDRVKQTLFAVLEGGSLGSWPVPFLDLYAGSGAAGIEALSRGAPRATFVEQDRDALRAIKENLERAGLTDRARLVRSDVMRFLDDPRELDLAAEGDEEPAGAVLLDPPYEAAAILPALERLGREDGGWLTDDAVVVAKHFWRDQPPREVGRLEWRRERRFGETMLTFYVRAS